MPPYLRLVPASACWKRFENDALLFGQDADAAVGNFERDHRAGAAKNRMLVAPTIVGDTHTARRTPPCSVNLNALESKFLSTCWRRFESVTMLRIKSGSVLISKLSLRWSAS